MARAVKTGLHVETFLCVMGALAGFAAQMGVREELIGKQKKSEQDVFKIFRIPNNFLYYSGSNLGALLTDIPRALEEDFAEDFSVKSSLTLSHDFFLELDEVDKAISYCLPRSCML